MSGFSPHHTAITPMKTVAEVKNAEVKPIMLGHDYEGEAQAYHAWWNRTQKHRSLIAQKACKALGLAHVAVKPDGWLAEFSDLPAEVQVDCRVIRRSIGVLAESYGLVRT